MLSWSVLWTAAKTVLGLVTGQGRGEVARAEAEGRIGAARAEAEGRIGAELAAGAAAEAVARADERKAYAAAGWWWVPFVFILPPAFIASFGAAIHFFMVVLDSIPFTAFEGQVAALPGPMADWQGIILTTIVGGGGYYLLRHRS